MTVDEIVDAALARSVEYDAEYPSTRSLMYRRIGIRQQQLFLNAARQNPDYFGICVVSLFKVDGTINLRDLEDADGFDPTAGVQKVEIADPGTSSLTAGQTVNMITFTDPDAGFAPRATVRNFVLKGVGTDLDDVVSVKIFYPFRPADFPVQAGGLEPDLPRPHQELLVIDLSRDLVKKTIKMEPATKAAIVQLLDKEEGEALGMFLLDVNEFLIAQASRFSIPPSVGTA